MTPHIQPTRSWQILLIGGASGVGKTSVSYRLAQYFRVGTTEVDDFQVMLMRMTTPEQQPALHYWEIHPEANQQPAEKIMENGIAIGKVMLPGLEAVIVNHLESQTPIILEGDFILPELTILPSFENIPKNVRVAAVFLHEPDEQQLLNNFLAREPDAGLQIKRARVSWLYGQWLKTEADRLGVLTLPARPWSDVFDRIVEAIT